MFPNKSSGRHNNPRNSVSTTFLGFSFGNYLYSFLQRNNTAMIRLFEIPQSESSEKRTVNRDNLSTLETCIFTILIPYYRGGAEKQSSTIGRNS